LGNPWTHAQENSEKVRHSVACGPKGRGVIPCQIPARVVVSRTLEASARRRSPKVYCSWARDLRFSREFVQVGGCSAKQNSCGSRDATADEEAS
jgi:hypothetical protein